MAERRRPRLVPLSERPVRTRRSIYKELVAEFANDPDIRYAKLEDVGPTAVVSVKRAIRALGLTTVNAFTSNGVIILEKTDVSGEEGSEE